MNIGKRVHPAFDENVWPQLPEQYMPEINAIIEPYVGLQFTNAETANVCREIELKLNEYLKRMQVMCGDRLITSHVKYGNRALDVFFAFAVQ